MIRFRFPLGPVPRHELLLDSNLLLLLLVGSYNTSLIAGFKRLNAYTLRDFEILSRLTATFRRLIATPHILTEVSNLANSLPESVKRPWFGHFGLHMNRIDERTLPALELAQASEFSLFGLTDTALSLLASTTLVVTADERLCSHLQRRKLFAIGLNQLRVGYDPRH